MTEQNNAGRSAPRLLSVIIPTLNEADQLPGLLGDLNTQLNVTLEIIIGDGGSVDATTSVAKAFGALVIPVAPGRGTQMNAAAARASGDYFLFLHADSRIDDRCLLSNAVIALESHLLKHDRVAGHFCLRFMRTTHQNRLAFRYAEEKTAFNRADTTNGDQGLLIPKVFFKHLGGFDESLPFLEDQRIAGKIRLQGEWITLPGHLYTSARRFETEGFHRRYILMSMIMGLHSVGAEDFFERAPGLYKTQQETGRLLLFPFFELIWRMIWHEWGVTGTIGIFYLLGRYVRQNSWQMFYFVDVVLRPFLGNGRYPLLNVHDRVFAPCINFRVCDAVTGAASFIWFMTILTPYFWLTDQCAEPENARKC